MTRPHTASPTEPEPPPAEALDDNLALVQGALAEMPGHFDDLLRRLVLRAMGDGPDAQQALADGAMAWNGCTVVLRRNPDNDYVEFFCDVGLPLVHAEEAAYRAALEINLCRTYPGITLGVHPESGRIVGTLSVHLLLVADEESCANYLDLLTAQIRRLLASHALPLDPAA